MARNEPKPIETANKFLVALQGDSVRIMRPPVGLINKADALALAGWLVALAEEEEGQFSAVLEAIQSE